MVGTFTYNDHDYHIDLNENKITTYNGIDHYLKTSGQGQVLRQVLNQMKTNKLIHFDRIYIKTTDYSMGNNLRCYVVGSYEDDLEIIQELVDHFQYGNFNGMIDLYEDKDHTPKLVLENNTILDIGVKYTFLEEGFPYGTQGYYQNRFQEVIQ